jgi:putative hydrolase
MEFLLDIHCHTLACGHAYCTFMENTAYAAKIGLKLTGVADHGPALPGSCHMFHFANINKIGDTIHGIRFLKGVEANIMDDSGKLDLPDWLLKKLDFVIASLHADCLPPGDKDFNTKTLINTMKNPLVHIIGHPGDVRYPIDIEAITDAAKRSGTILEINNLSLKPETHRYGGDGALREILAHCREKNVPVIAGSDAHVDTDVGNLTLAGKLIEESGIDEKLVLNTDLDRFFEALSVKKSL